MIDFLTKFHSFRMSSIMDEIIKILCALKKSHCKILFGESIRFGEWLKEKGIDDNVVKYFFLYLHF